MCLLILTQETDSEALAEADAETEADVLADSDADTEADIA